jgi:DNA-binding NtrC family response regulator
MPAWAWMPAKAGPAFRGIHNVLLITACYACRIKQKLNEIKVKNKMKSKKKILIIDDDKLILKSIEKQLKNENFILETEDNPIIGLEKINNNSYDLVLCDIKMKSLTGFQVLEDIKINHPKIPVIILTGYVDDKMIEEAINLGCKDFLFKPLRKKILIERINKALEP